MPNVTDVKTLNSLAKMAANAYANDQDGGVWWDLEGKWNVVRFSVSSSRQDAMMRLRAGRADL